MKHFTIETKKGSILEVQEGGRPDGHPVFTLHGTPGSRLLYEPHEKNAAANGIRLIGYNRPGYGFSTRCEGRNVAQAASDVETIADHIGLDRFAVWGHSGGGSHSLACAALLPRRVVAAACISGLAPYGGEGLDFFKGMGEFNVSDFKLLLANREEWERKNTLDAEAMANATGGEVMEMLSSLISAVDRKSVDERVFEFLHRQFVEAFSSNVYGMIDDGLASMQPWGFDPSSIKVPLQIWHGKQDMFVPFGHGEWLAGHIPGAEAHMEPGEGHLSLFINRVGEIQQWLASRF